MSKLADQKIFFHGLDELRALAAFSVCFHHIELFKSREGLPSLLDSPFLRNFILSLGSNSVIAFFVLSGFLITYLLLFEKKQNGSINIKAFYIKRVLRIWPLYFLIVFIAFAIMPLLNNTGLFNNQTFYPTLINELNYGSLIFFLLFMSNFALIHFKPIAGASQSWSVSVEEQFYLIWPHIIRMTKNVQQALVVIIVLYLIKTNINQFLPAYLHPYLNAFSVEYMCIGAVTASLLFFNNCTAIISKICSNIYLFMFLLLSLLYVLIMVNNNTAVAFLVAMLILFLITQKTTIKSLKYFGKISFGIYMLHPLMMFISFSIANTVENSILFNSIMYLLTFILTIIGASISYRYIELPALSLKQKYTVIKSGE